MSKLDNSGPAFPRADSISPDGTFWEAGNNGMTLRDWFASQAMVAVMNEAQEMVPATFWDWVKSLLIGYAGLTFLHVQHRVVDGVYADAASRAYGFSDAMLEERKK